MPFVKVYFTRVITHNYLERIHDQLIAATCGIKEFGLSEGDVTVLFPTDMLQRHVNLKIFVEVVGLFSKPERTREVRSRLVEALGKVVVDHFPDARVECLISPFDAPDGFWSSGMLPTLRCRIYQKEGEGVTEVYDTMEEPYEKKCSDLPTWPLVKTVIAKGSTPEKAADLLHKRMRQARIDLDYEINDPGRWFTSRFDELTGKQFQD